MTKSKRPGPYKVQKRRAAGEVIANCRRCGEPFQATSARSAYCSHECKVAVWTQRRRERRQTMARIEHLPKTEQWVHAKETKLEEQNGLCALCSEPMSELTACLDHDHQTGRLRGVLCRRCNVGIGFFKDSEELMTRAIMYIKKHKDEV